MNIPKIWKYKINEVALLELKGIGIQLQVVQ